MESFEASTSLNPWLLHLQKMNLELTCPRCLRLLGEPTLLPCDHIFCKSCLTGLAECPVCMHPFEEKEIRQAPYMENIVKIYKNLDATSHTIGKSSQIGNGIELRKKMFKSNHTVTFAEDLEMAGGSSGTDVGVIIAVDNSNNPSSSSWKSTRKRSSRTRTKSNLKGVTAVQQKPPMRREKISNRTDNGSELICIENKASSFDPLESLNLMNNECAFCHSSEITNKTGPMLHYHNGTAVVGDAATTPNIIHVHEKCNTWAPQVYYKDEKILNLESELARAAELSCEVCGKRGAALGCSFKSCPKYFHVPCALNVYCKWDSEEFMLHCPTHYSQKFPREKSRKKGRMSELSNIWSSPCGAEEFVFCASNLPVEEKSQVVKFARKYEATMSDYWNSKVTHFTASVDKNGSFKRTVDVLLTILNGGWILSMDWVKACNKEKILLDETPYELNLDDFGVRDGPKTGRLRALSNEPKLFKNLIFYLSGDFELSKKVELMDLINAAGGFVIGNKEKFVSQKRDDETGVVIYNSDLPENASDEGDGVILQRLAAAQKLANEIGSHLIEHKWIFDSIAMCKLQPFPSIAA